MTGGSCLGVVDSGDFVVVASTSDTVVEVHGARAGYVMSFAVGFVGAKK